MYLLLLLATVVLKWHLLWSVFGEELSTAFGFTSTSWLDTAGTFFLIMASDAAQLFFVSAAIIVLGRFVLGFRFRWVLALPLAAVVAAGLLNWIAYRELGQPASLDVLWLGATWVSKHPEALYAVLGRPAAIGVFVALIAAALLMTSLLIRARSRPVPMGWSSALVIVSAIWIPAVVFTATRQRGTDSIARRPYWTTTLQALSGGDNSDPALDGSGGLHSLRAEYRRAVFRGGSPGPQETRGFTRPVRYVVVIVLETAPARYYQIAGNSRFPVFAAMSREGIVADQHYSTMPYTAEALYSIVTGLYPPHRVYRMASRNSPRSSVVSKLREHNFETTFVDAFDIDWSPGNRMGDMWRGLGFDNLATGRSPRQRGVRNATPEARSFELVAGAIDSARSHGKGAFILLATAQGHFPWSGTAQTTPAESARGMEGAAVAADSLTGKLIQKLARDGVLDESLVIVTGDHGLRFREEFRSLGLQPPDMELTFKVPFLLYAPGLETGQRRISIPTSHVDIAPTILRATGMPEDSLLLHGISLFTDTMPQRLLFGFATGLAPADYLISGAERYTVNHLTGRVTRRSEPGALPTIAWDADSARHLMARAQKVIARSAAFQTSILSQ